MLDKITDWLIKILFLMIVIIALLMGICIIKTLISGGSL